MARKDKDYGANIIEDPRRPGKLYVRVYHAAREVSAAGRVAQPRPRSGPSEIKAAVFGEPPSRSRGRRGSTMCSMTTVTAKAREGKEIMAASWAGAGYWSASAAGAPMRSPRREVEEWRDPLLETLSPPA